MATIKSSAEHLTLNADGSGNDILFQSNGSQVGSLTAEGVLTATSFAGSGASLTGISSVTALSGLSDAVGTVATHNLGLGENALDSLASGGNYNVAVGKNALTAVSTGDFNVAIGFEAGAGIVTSSANTAIGTYALYGTTGAYNVAIGDNTAQAALSGTGNTAVGRQALTLGAACDTNTCIGYTAGDNITSGSGNIMIGDVSAASATDDNQLDIGGWIKGVAGQITMPNQPAFCVKLSGNQSNITAASGDVTISLDTERFDQNADFNTTTHYFTAPVTGRYQLNLICFLEQVDASSGYMKIMINTSNVAYHNYCDMDQMSGDMDQWTFPLSVCCDMDSGDTAYCTVKQLGGTTQTDIQALTCFSGFLAC